MANVLVAPNKIETYSKFKLFLAGGITGVSDWQSVMINKLINIDNLVMFNPRRENFPIHDPNAAFEQIEWEYTHFIMCNAILFWFAEGTDNPIVLYELGKWGNSGRKMIFIGTEPGYSREQDVIIQTRLTRPNIAIHHTLDDLATEVKKYLNNELVREKCI